MKPLCEALLPAMIRKVLREESHIPQVGLAYAFFTDPSTTVLVIHPSEPDAPDHLADELLRFSNAFRSSFLRARYSLHEKKKEWFNETHM